MQFRFTLCCLLSTYLASKRSLQLVLLNITDNNRYDTGFYTKLNVWGSLGLNFDYDGGPIIENRGPIFLYKRRILGGSKSFREGIRTGLSCQTGVAKHQVIFASQPFVAT